MATVAANPTSTARQGEFWRCVGCKGDAELDAAGGAVVCPSCGASYPVRDGVVVVSDRTTSNNEVARSFYDGPLWPKFRFWEWYTFILNGGEKRARNKVLRHLPTGEDLKILDVAIGDGVYLPWLPKSWSVVGVDVSTRQLEACRKHVAGRDATLVLGEAEDLPVRSGSFDACLSIGGFNYFNDPEKSLREMARAVKPGGLIVVSDEIPSLPDRQFFGKIGMGSVDRWMYGKITKNLGPEFTAMVERYKSLDVAAIGRRVLPGSTYELIWMGVGYVLVGRSPG